MAVRNYDSDRDSIPLPPGMDPAWLAKEGVNVLLNGGVKNAEELFRKFRSSSPLLAGGASLVDFITAAMTFEDEKMELAMSSMKKTQKMCDVDSLYEGVINKRPSDKWKTEERIQRMIIWADCELFMAFLMFLKQSVVDFVKAGFHMRRAWKMYEKCNNELSLSNGEAFTNGTKGSNKGTPKKKLGDRKASPEPLSSESKATLRSSLSFGYGLIQVAISIVPAGLLKVCELLGFTADRYVGLEALEICSKSEDMKAPIARLTLLWYHTVVRPFCALDGNNLEAGLLEASNILQETEVAYPNSGIFLYFKALIHRLKGELDDALEVLERAMLTTTDQREVALLCYYDKGWCYMMKLEWEKAIPCFSRLRGDSKWSEAYYTYLLAVTEGALGRTTSAYDYLRSVPKLIIRKTQLENFLARKANLFKKVEPTKEEYTILCLELLYLWNALSQCGESSLRRMLIALENCRSPSMQPLKILIMGVVYATLNDRATAMQYLHVASAKNEGKPMDPHVVPFSLYELAVLQLENPQEAEKGKSLLIKVKEQYKDYDFENRLNFRIHAALNSLKPK
ncbi:tetratricopeptide repeat protein 39C-like [Rhopilema esculentum]|uniref:tetratricopeptide repeat protein 39C-like n=1 Tax=Rhopilema esculentum TaxID=499914 RepID=UPI0031E2CA5E|eukprot:gene6214-11623_t